MKTLLMLLITVSTLMCSNAQKGTDTAYATTIVSAEWMPDGKALLYVVVKFHKTNEQAPFFSKVFLYNLQSKQSKPLFENGSNLSPSPDGKTIAFLKRDDNKRTSIYFYNIDTKQETVLKPDTLQKNALSWSPDGTKLMYNISHGGTSQFATIYICVPELATGKVKQITQSGKDKSYDPAWCPDSRKIVYYLEKGDNHDQIWLTDTSGSFHTNLTGDTSTHNYFPGWFGEQTIFYTQSPSTLMMMNTDGSNRRKIEGIGSSPVKFNAIAGKMAYIKSVDDNKLILFDWKKKTGTVILDGKKMIEHF